MDFLISDLHLHQGQKFVPELFQHFMQNIAPEANNLYVLGDLFEYWVGDDFLSDFNQQIIQSFRDYADHQHQLYFIHGNRDFLLGHQFATATGGQLLDELTVTNIGSVPTLLMHGDTLCTDDVDYQNFRIQLRDPDWQMEFLKQPLHHRKKIAEKLRDDSIQQQKNKPAEIMDVSSDEVLRVFSKFQIKRIIHGHTHRQYHHHLIRDNISLERVVLGDWGKTGNYCKCDNNQLELINFSL